MSSIFHRLFVEDWQSTAQAAYQLGIFFIFLYVVVRACSLKSERAKKMAEMPLED
jgi:hypothetical protein